MIRKLCYALVIFTLVVLVGFALIFKVPPQPQQLLLGQEERQLEHICYQNDSPEAIDNEGEINLLVWNIYKQSRENWQIALDRFSEHAHLLLLQEVSLTEEFKDWIKQQSWGSNYVSAFSVFDTRSGVLNLATQLPVKACAYTATEPWLRLPKSGLYALYQLSNGQQLAVINVHAINFTLGTEDYEQQIAMLKAALNKHTGPMIVAGDFNSWSEQRTTKLKEVLMGLQLTAIQFSPDNRTRFISGLPLDHVFYKGLTFQSATTPVTDASDHNPLIVKFNTLP